MKDDSNFFDNLDDYLGDDSNNFPPIPPSIMMSLVDKPFGILWSVENMERFLKHRGYVIIERQVDDSSRMLKVAVRPGESVVPDAISGNIAKIFAQEIQLAILEKLM